MNYNSIIGNDIVKKDLQETVNSNLIGHSYIFQGPKGVGKYLFAKDFAKIILCEEKNGCNECKSCIMFNSNNHPDFMIINEEEETIKIEAIREMLKKVIEKPIISKNKVYIINAADKMTKDAQNCLLKTLEEPPEYITIILIVSNENMLLTTIKSRCTKIIFNRLTEDELKKYIEENEDIRKANLSEDLIKSSNGSISDLIKIAENKEVYEKIESVLEKANSMSKLEFYMSSKVIYDKEKIYDILEYMISILYKISLTNKAYVSCVSIVQNTINKLNANNNFDMSIDNMIFNIWEDINEKSNWS